MKPKRCCDKILVTKFCPECGTKYEDIKIDTVYPYKFTVYLTGDPDSRKKVKIIDELDITDDEIEDNIRYCDYEIECTFELLKDGTVNLVSAK